MKMMLTTASRERRVSAMSTTLALFLSFFLLSFSVALEHEPYVFKYDVFSSLSLSGQLSAKDIAETSFEISNEEWRGSCEISSYAHIPKTFAGLILEPFNCRLEFCSLNFWGSQQAELIDQTNHIISALTTFRKVKSFSHAFIFNQRIII